MNRNLLLVSLLLGITWQGISQKISMYEKPWFENNHANLKMLQSNNPMLDNYDVTFYKLDLNIINTSKTISGCCTIRARVVGTPLSVLVFDFINSMTVDSVKVNGILYTSTHTNDELQLTLTSGLPVGDSFTTEVYYHGSSGGTGIKTGQSGTWGAQITWTLSESYHAKDWFPCKQVLSDKADSAYIFLTCNNTLKAGSNGVLTHVVTLPNSKVRYEWIERHPIDFYLLSFTVSNYQEYNLYAHPAGISDSVLVQNYLYSNSNYLNSFKTDIDRTPGFIELLSGLYGLYPFYNEKYGHCTAPIGGGMEHQTMTTLSTYNFELIIHELGHQWFGDNVTCSNWQDIWVNEGFATYTHYLGLQYLQSQGDADNEMLTEHNDIMASTAGSVYIPIASINDENRIFDYRLSYEKGSAIIHQIRYIINNDSLFFAVLKAYQSTYGHSVASGEDFKNMITTVTGLDFTDYFNQWYYGEGYPTYYIGWGQQGSDVTVNINQICSAPTVTPFFKIPLEIKFTWAGGDTTVRFDQTYNNQSFQTVIPHQIQSLTIDPREWIIHKVGLISQIQPAVYMPGQMAVFPNPAGSEAQFYCSISELKNSSFEIRDVTGKVCLKFSMTSDYYQLDLISLPAGIYTISSERNAIAPVKLIKL